MFHFEVRKLIPSKHSLNYRTNTLVKCCLVTFIPKSFLRGARYGSTKQSKKSRLVLLRVSSAVSLHSFGHRNAQRPHVDSLISQKSY